MIKNEQWAYKNMANENGVYSTTCTMHNEYYTEQLTKNFKPAPFPHCILYSKTESRSN
jgi:hypothetical protein